MVEPIKLTPRQRDYLQLLIDKPLWQTRQYKPWFHRLWVNNLIDIIGKSVYITPSGRAALSRTQK